MVFYGKKVKTSRLEFTGERLIPELNKGTAFYYEHLARYLFASQIVKEKVVLDAGCGSGYGSFILAKYGKAKKVYAVDISQEAIDYAQSKYFHKNIKFQVNDAEKLKTISAKSVDVIVSFEVIEHLNDQEKFLNQIKRVLKTNGVFIVSTPNKYTYPEGNLFHTKELYPEEFKKLLKKYFKNVRFYHQAFEFAQIVKPEKLKEDFTLEEKFSLLTNQTLTNSINPKNSQYIIAICSNKKLPKPNLLSLTSNKVDNFDLTSGFISLGKQFNQLQTTIEKLQKDLSQKSLEAKNYKNQIEQIKTQVQNLENTLNMIKSAKFFKLWQGYCKIRNKILKKNYESKIT